MPPRKQKNQTLRDIQFEEMRRQIQQLQEMVNAQQTLLRKKLSKKPSSSPFRNPFHTQKIQTTQPTVINNIFHNIFEEESYELSDEEFEEEVTPPVYDEEPEEEDAPAVYDEEFEEEVAPPVYDKESIPADQGELLSLHTATVEGCERKEKEEQEAEEQKEIQNTNASNIFSISSSYSFVQEFGKQVDIIPSTPLFIQPNFGTLLQWDKEINKDDVKAKLIPLPPSEIRQSSKETNAMVSLVTKDHIKISKDDVNHLGFLFLIEQNAEYDVNQARAPRDLNNKAWFSLNCVKTYLILPPAFEKAKVKYVKLVFDPGGSRADGPFK